MADRYWVGPAGSTGNLNNTSYWSTTSGGSGGASVPGASDDVYLDQTAVAHGSCRVDINASCASLTQTAGQIVFDAYNTDMDCGGDFRITSGSWRVGTGDLTVSGDVEITVSTWINEGDLNLYMDGSGKTVELLNDFEYRCNHFEVMNGGDVTIGDFVNLRCNNSTPVVSGGKLTIPTGKQFVVYNGSLTFPSGAEYAGPGRLYIATVPGGIQAIGATFSGSPRIYFSADYSIYYNLPTGDYGTAIFEVDA